MTPANDEISSQVYTIYYEQFVFNVPLNNALSSPILLSASFKTAVARCERISSQLAANSMSSSQANA
jgi:hypothetical protein